MGADGDSCVRGWRESGTMNKYESLGIVGEGSYGVVMKCVHRKTRQVVAIKKFLESDDDYVIRKIALREIAMLKKLRHENLVNLIEVFRRKRHLFLVLEYVDHTILHELEQHLGGLGHDTSRNYIWQILRAVDFCHSWNVIHRDIKPENLLVSQSGVVKLCDFGFARLAAPVQESFTDYVATRWYRSPELLVGDTHYGKEVDVWAIGCVFAELMTGDPMFPGESDIDQLFLIIQKMGKLAKKHQELMDKNPMFQGVKFKLEEIVPLKKWFTTWSITALEFLQECLQLDPEIRPVTSQLLEHTFFSWDSFPEKFLPELTKKVHEEFSTYYDVPAVSKGVTFSHKGETGIPVQQVPSKQNNMKTFTFSSSSQTKFQQMLRPPTRIIPLDSNIISHAAKNLRMQDLPSSSSMTSAVCIPRIESSKSDHPLLLSPQRRLKCNVSPLLPVKTPERETTLQTSPWHHRQSPVAGTFKINTTTESNPATVSWEEQGTLHGYKTHLYARHGFLEFNKKNDLTENNSILPNISSPVPPSPTRLDGSRKVKSTPFRAAAPPMLEPLPKVNR